MRAVEDPPAHLLLLGEVDEHRRSIVEVHSERRVARWSLGRHGRLTVSPACANVTLLIRRVAHLAQRAVEDSPRWTRAVGDQAGHPLVGKGRESRSLVMMPKSLRAHCNECGGERNHGLVHSESTTWSEEDYGVSGTDTYEMLRCLGCDRIQLRHRSCFSEEEGERVQYFPPSIFRKSPGWISAFHFGLNKDEAFVRDLLLEIYSALQNNQPRLAAMGVRALLEHVMIAKVGDQGSFAKNLGIFEAKGFVSRIQREHLEAILEAGHAAMHRGYKPSQPDLITLVDIAESIVETVYLQGTTVESLRRRVPERGTQ